MHVHSLGVLFSIYVLLVDGKYALKARERGDTLTHSECIWFYLLSSPSHSSPGFGAGPSNTAYIWYTIIHYDHIHINIYVRK